MKTRFLGVAIIVMFALSVIPGSECFADEFPLISKFQKLFVPADAEPVQESAVEITVESTPEPISAVTDLILTNETADEIIALASIETLKTVDARTCTEYEALLELYNLRPDCKISWNITLQGKKYSNETKEIKLKDSIEGVLNVILYLPELETLDMLELGTEVSVADVDRMYELRPDIFYVFKFPLNHWMMRSDMTVYSTLHGEEEYRFTDEDLYPMLKYCKKMKALDLGHNDIRDLTYIGQMEDLEILIIADNPHIVDASPLANLSKLFYLEYFMNTATVNYDWLNSLTKLRYLNLCYCDNIKGDISFLANMPDMQFLMIKYSGVDRDTVSYWNGILPDAYIDIYDGSVHSCDGGWRENKTYYMIRYNFNAWRAVVEYRDYTDVDYDWNYERFPYA